MSTLDLGELRRLLGFRPPLHRRPQFQHVSFDRRPCDRPAEHECDPGPDGHRPRYVCGSCLAFQVCGIGPVVLADEVEVVRVNAEGGIVRSERRKRR